MIFAISGLLTIATGVIAGGLILFGVITAATGGLALEALGWVVIAAGVAIVIIAIIDASEERDVSLAVSSQALETPLDSHTEASRCDQPACVCKSGCEASCRTDAVVPCFCGTIWYDPRTARRYKTPLTVPDEFVSNEILGIHSDWFNEYSHDGYIHQLQLCTRDKIVEVRASRELLRHTSNEDADALQPRHEPPEW